MRAFALAIIGMTAAGTAFAQPIIIPLQPQKQEEPPAVSSPPVAPPMAGPSLPSTNDVAGGSPAVNPQEETASSPPPKP